MSAPKRFFVERIGEEVLLEGEEFRHAANALRLTEGDEVTLFDGSGEEYTAIIAKARKGSFLLHVTGKTSSDREPNARTLLLVGALKGDKTELVVQKATELGVRRIGVFASRYCAAYQSENKTERLRRVAREAAKQCLRASVPEILSFDDLASALQCGREYENKFFACEFLEAGTGAAILPVDGSCALVVGSEGGFAREEYELALSLGYRGISLGRRILRAETAAIALLSVVMYGLGELR